MQKQNRYVEVDATFDERGNIMPKSLVIDTTRYDIDRVLSTHRAASLKVGGTGYRYEISALGKTTYLYFEGPWWFVEEKSDEPPIGYDPIYPDAWMVGYNGPVVD